MRQQHQRSRNTTPSAVPIIAGLPETETVETETLDLHFDVFRNLTYEDMVDPVSSSTMIPDSRGLDGLLDRLHKLAAIIETRGLTCDRGMRLLAQNRKLRIDEMAVEMGREEERRHDDDGNHKRSNKKKRKAADSLAPQGGNTGEFPLCCAVLVVFVMLFGGSIHGALSSARRQWSAKNRF